MSRDYTKNTQVFRCYAATKSRLQHTTSLILIRAEHMSLMDSNT